jgi:pimeloyl-ACP methyl ester carboxylesterase
MDGKIDINGIEVRYKTTGAGSDVLLLHGWGCDHTIWAGVQAHLEGRFRVTAVDLPGFGESTEPPVAWSVEDFTANIEELVARLGLREPMVFGHSHGGRVALLYASRNVVPKMVLVDAAGVKPRRSPKYYAKVWSFKAMKHLAPLVFGKQKAQEMIERRRNAAGSADYRAASSVMRATLSRVVNEDLRAVMPLIKAPTLLVWGERDTATPLSDAQKMERLIPDAGLVVFAGAGHFSFHEQPAQFAAVIDSFLSENDEH